MMWNTWGARETTTGPLGWKHATDKWHQWKPKPRR